MIIRTNQAISMSPLFERGNRMKPINQAMSMLPLFNQHVDEIVSDSLGQYENLLRVLDKPHVLDDKTVDRMVYVYREQLENVALFRGQVQRWREKPPAEEEQYHIEQFEKRLDELEEVTQKIVALVEKIRPHTIDKIMAMPEGELANKILSGELKIPEGEINHE